MDLQRELKRIIPLALLIFFGFGIAYAIYHRWYFCGPASYRCISSIVASSTWMLMGAVILADQLIWSYKKKGGVRISPRALAAVIIHLMFGCIGLTFSVINLISGCGAVRYGC